MNVTAEFTSPVYGATHDAEGFRIMTSLYSAPAVGEGSAAFHIPGNRYSSSYSIENIGSGWYKITHDSRGGALFFEMGRAPWGMFPVYTTDTDGQRRCVATLGIDEKDGNYCFSTGTDWYTYKANTVENGGIRYYDTVPETLIRLASRYIM